MAIALVQSRSTRSVGSVASLALAFSSNLTAGNMALVRTGAFTSNAQTINTPTGTFTYTDRCETVRTSTFRAINQISDSQNVAGGAETVTVSATASMPLAIGIYEYSGLAASNAFDLTDTGADGNQVTGTTTTVATSGNTNQADELVFACLDQTGATATITPDTGTGWVQREENEDSAQEVYSDADLIVSSTGTYTSTWTISASRSESMCIATYKMAAASTTVMPRKALLGVGL